MREESEEVKIAPILSREYQKGNNCWVKFKFLLLNLNWKVKIGPILSQEYQKGKK